MLHNKLCLCSSIFFSYDTDFVDILIQIHHLKQSKKMGSNISEIATP